MRLFLTRLWLSECRLTYMWISNPYRIHQRLMMAADGDPRLLFRVDEANGSKFILVQSHLEPDWNKAFNDFPVLAGSVEMKQFEPALIKGIGYHFRVLANPTVKRDGKKLGLLHEEEQINWLRRKFESGGLNLLACQVASNGFSRSFREVGGVTQTMTHLSVLYNGIFSVSEIQSAQKLIENGVGPSKGLGFGLLSIRKVSVV